MLYIKGDHLIDEYSNFNANTGVVNITSANTAMEHIVTKVNIYSNNIIYWYRIYVYSNI